MTAHTPGPWHSARTRPYEVSVFDRRYAVVASVYSAGAREDGHGTQEANAALIAAAPETKEQRDELLAALERMVRATTDDGRTANEWERDLNLATLQARAAFAKATGGAL